MVYSETVKKAMLIAYHAHMHQKDRGGYPYIFHPIHVAEHLHHNSNLSRLHKVTEDDIKRVKKYKKAIEILENTV